MPFFEHIYSGNYKLDLVHEDFTQKPAKGSPEADSTENSF